jgi:cytochrome c oxidase cbb3-type subunit 3
MSQQHTENSDHIDFKEKYGDKLMDHDYDGIKELDNPAPKWIMAIFYITIAFSFYYGLYYFVLDGPSQDEEYTMKSAEHDAKYANLNAEIGPLVLLTDEESIAEGKTLYGTMNCAVCHGALGEGNAIGPNLTDNYWLHGCDFDAVFDIIKNGKVTKGMTAFKNQMNDVQIQKLTSYLLEDMLGSNPPGAKDVQGKECN